MQKIIFTFIILFAVCPASAQINQFIEYDSTGDPSYGLPGHFSNMKAFTGSFSFSPLPAPLQPCKVDFKFVSCGTSHIISENDFWGKDWVLQIFYHNDVVKIIGDTLFPWPGPHKAGDVFSGSFEFVPIKSGISTICFDFKGSNQSCQPHTLFRRFYGQAFEYCINEDGELLLLDQCLPANRSKFKALETFFIPSDSIILCPRRDRIITQGPIERDAFKYEIMISPIPKIGESSRITYRLNTEKSLNMGVNQLITSKGIDIIDLPDKLDKILSKGELIEHSMNFIPIPIRSDNFLATHFTYIVNNKIETQSIPCYFLFNSDGLLKLINDSHIWLSYSDLPDNFPEHDPGRDNKSVNIDVFDVKEYRK